MPGPAPLSRSSNANNPEQIQRIVGIVELIVSDGIDCLRAIS
jgi:hypothetical protein